jgi:hypothetical protein
MIALNDIFIYSFYFMIDSLNFKINIVFNDVAVV